MGRKKELKPLERTELERIELAHNQGLAAALAAMTGDAAYVVAPDGKRVATLVRPDALHDLSRELMWADLCTAPDLPQAVRVGILAMVTATGCQSPKERG